MAEDRNVNSNTDLSRSARRVLRAALLALVPALAMVTAWWFTRTRTVAPGSSGHVDHSAMGTSDTTRPVLLDAASARRIGVTFAAVTREPLGRVIRTAGQVVVDETQVRTVALKVDGWVERLYVDYTGQRMSRGAPLLTLYSPMLVAAQEELLLARQLTRDVATSNEGTREGAADLVQAAWRRLLWWDVSESEIVRVERAGTAQRALTVFAPVGGVVLEKTVTAGQRVMAGEPLYRVADLSSVWVDGEVYERDLGSIRVDQQVKATFEALPGVTIYGRVTYVYPTLSPETRTARVRVTLPNPTSRLLPGMYATLRIASDDRASALSVPRGAVLATGDRQLVFVRRPDGRLEPRLVETGSASDARIEILRGVAMGDTVVASATFLVDAESNLESALGGMANMPGMEMPVPSPARSPAAAPSEGPIAPAPPSSPMRGMQGTPDRSTPPASRPPVSTPAGVSHPGGETS